MQTHRSNASDDRRVTKLRLYETWICAKALVANEQPRAAPVTICGDAHCDRKVRTRHNN